MMVVLAKVMAVPIYAQLRMGGFVQQRLVKLAHVLVFQRGLWKWSTEWSSVFVGLDILKMTWLLALNVLWVHLSQ